MARRATRPSAPRSEPPWRCSHATTSPAKSSRRSRDLWTRRCRGSCQKSRHIRTLRAIGRCDMAATREARAVWNGDLMSGTGLVSAASSGKFSDLPVSWSARTEAPAGKSSPEELLAAAHASCFAMALSAGLARAGTPPSRLDVRSRVTFDKVGDSWTVVSSELEVKGDVPKADATKFARAAEDAKENCPISRALKGNVKLSVKANLSS